MPDYVKLAATAKRLIEANARSVTLYKHDTAAADVAKPWDGVDLVPDAGDGGDSFSVLACFVPASGSGLGRMVAGFGSSLLNEFQQFALIAVNSLPTPVPDLDEYDQLTDGSQSYGIGRRELLQPSTVPLFYALGIRS